MHDPEVSNVIESGPADDENKVGMRRTTVPCRYARFGARDRRLDHGRPIVMTRGEPGRRGE